MRRLDCGIVCSSVVCVCACLLMTCPAVQTCICHVSRSRTALLRLRGGQAATADYYAVLGLRKGERGENRIRQAYHKMALRCHPDRAPPEKKEQAERAFKALKEAYDVLMDPHQRQAHDGAAMKPGFSAQFMPSARPEDIPSPFDSLSAWEEYFGIPCSSEESSEDDEAEKSSGELKTLKEALSRVYAMPSSCKKVMPSILDSISVREQYFGLPISSGNLSVVASNSSSHLAEPYLNAKSDANSDVFIDSISEWEKYLGIDSHIPQHTV